MNLKYQISIAVSVAVLAFSPIVAVGALTHVVAKGDTLYSISKKHKTTVEEIKSLNGLRTNRISVGSVLSVKASKTDSLKTGKTSGKTVTTKKVSSKKSTQAARSYDTYLVKKGDTFVIIAREYGISPKLLKKMNGVKSNRLAIGQQLKVPVLDVTDEPVGVAEASAEISERAEARVALSEGADDKPVDEMSPMETLRVQHLIDVASNYLGVPYKFGGGNRKGIDCSAFVQKVFGFLSVDLPRTAREQFRIGEKVAKSELREGDLVFFKTYAKFPSHVGIYIGDNKFIHASSINKKVSVSTLDAPYYTKRYIGAKRLPVQDRF